MTLVVVISPPGSAKGEHGVRLAKELAADIVLTGEAAGYALKGRLEGFCGTVYVIEEEGKPPGLKDEDMEKGVKRLSGGEFGEMLERGARVAGVF